MSSSRPAAGRSTDVRRRTVLPTTLQNFHANTSSTQPELPSEEYLDKMEEELNRKVDHDSDILVEGMAEIVKLAKVRDKDHFRVAQDMFQMKCRTESMIRAGHSLLSLSHTLKLLHLFSDTATPTAAREALSESLEAEIAQLRAKVAESWPVVPT